MGSPKLFSLGIEEEFQIIDPNTRELKSHIQQMLEESGKMVLKEQIKAEKASLKTAEFLWNFLSGMTSKHKLQSVAA